MSLDFFEQMAELNRPTVVKRPWMSKVELILGTVDLLAQIKAECLASMRYGLDLETSGLDCRAFPNAEGKLETVDKIVGVCIAPNRTKSYYLPIRHREKGSASNVPARLVMQLIRELQEAGCVAVFHNAKFDQKFLMYDPAGGTEWDDPKLWDDTLILAYLRNTRERDKSLKTLAKVELGREMIELTDLFMKEKKVKLKIDFPSLEPTWEPVIWYAAADSLNTLELYYLLQPLAVEKDKFGSSQKTIYQIEKICLTATIWMEQNRIYIDRKRLIELIQLGQAEWWVCINKVYDEVSAIVGRDVRPYWIDTMGKIFDPKVVEPSYTEVRKTAIKDSPPDRREDVQKSVSSLMNPKERETVTFPPAYDITIPGELGMMLRELGVQGLKPTDGSGKVDAAGRMRDVQVKTSKDVLKVIIEESGDTHPWMKSIRIFREVSKALGTTLFNLYEATSPERSPDGCVWANFNGLKTDTGRFSTPAKEDNPEWHGQVQWNVQGTTTTVKDKDNPKPECSRLQRETVAARPHHIFFAIDYSGVELRIVTNLSGESKWLKEFHRCSNCSHEFEMGVLPPPFCPECRSDRIGDLHTITALALFGGADKKQRGDGKSINFLLCYGGGGSAIQRKTNCDKEEGWRIKNQFDKNYPGLMRWQKGQHLLARKQKYVTTVFGRRYPVPDIDHELGIFRSGAERNAVNGPVQGTSADIMKLAMGLLYREFKKRGWLDKVLMTITMHDELGFEIHEDYASEAIPVIENIMCVETVKNLGWIVKLKVDTEFGSSWAVPNNLTSMTWNQQGGEWTTKLASFFPDRYANYLRLGGKAVDVDAAPTETKSTGPLNVVDPRVSVSPPAIVLGHVDEEEPEECLEEVTTRRESVSDPVPVVTLPTLPSPPPTAEMGESRMEKQGSESVFVVHTRKRTPEYALKLAKVINRCLGRGVDNLYIRDEHGNDLLGGPVRVASEEFKVISGYEGL